MKRFFILLSLFAAVSCSRASDLKELSLEEKVAKMIMVGFDGTQYSENSQVYKDITVNKVGGIILFERNITPVEKNLDSKAILADMCHRYAELRDDDLFIAIDQEGGLVTRLKEKYGFPKFVDAQYLGELDNVDSTLYYADLTADCLVEMGINTNFAPVMDVNINPNCPVIGKIKRSYSSDENIVIKHAAEVFNSFNNHHIYSSVKHYPGHGSSKVDSHLGFTDITDTYQQRELAPFKYFIDNGDCSMVMVSHLFNANIDDKYPASISEKHINGVLREELGWQGVVVSDDMLMKAIVDNYGFEKSVLLGINAGMDLFIYSGNLVGNKTPIAELFIKTVCKLVREGKIKESTIDQANARLDKLLDNRW